MVAAPSPLPAAIAPIIEPSDETATSTGKTPSNSWAREEDPSLPMMARTLVTGPPRPGNGGRTKKPGPPSPPASSGSGGGGGGPGNPPGPPQPYPPADCVDTDCVDSA